MPTFAPDFRPRLLALAAGLRGRGAGDGGRDGPRAGRAAFREHRTYAPGDDVRLLDWNVFLRSGELALKVFADDVAPTTVVVLDRSASAGPAGSTQDRTACELAAASGFLALAAGGTARLFALGPDGLKPVVAAAGRREVERWLRAIEELPPPAGEARWDAFREGGASAAGERRVLISDFLAAAPPVAALAAVATAARPSVFVVAAHAGPADAPAGPCVFADPETGALLAGAGDAAWREAYAAARAAHVAEILAACARRRTPAAAASGREPFEDLLAAAGALRP